MQTLRYAKQSRNLFCPSSSAAAVTSSSAVFFSSSTTNIAGFQPHLFPSPFFPSSPSPGSSGSSSSSANELKSKDLVLSFKEWFISRNNPLLDRIFEVLRKTDDSAVDSALCHFSFRLSEELVLDVLNYGKDNVLSCLKFFDWAGRQPGFYHTRATFNAIFRILKKAKLIPVMLDFLEDFVKQKYAQKTKFHNTLVIGYALAGKPVIALQVFGKMRFQGQDLDGFAYHVLLNALVEESFYDVVDTVVNQIKLRGFESEITHSIMVKRLCKQGELERAEEYLKFLLSNNAAGLSGIAVGTLVDALCKSNQFEKAAKLVKEFQETGLVPMECAYSVWIRDLVAAGDLDGALKFLKDKQLVEGYVPDVFRYNTLISRLLSENRLGEVCDLLIEMKENEILPDQVTMNATLCFLCKFGMMDAAMDIYDSSAELGLSVSCMAYNYLINTLLGDEDVSVDEAFRVLKNAIGHGYFPGKKTFSAILDILYREEKFDKLNELVLVSLDRNVKLPDSIYDKSISALSQANRVEDGYQVQCYLNSLNRVTGKNAYLNLIGGFRKLQRGDIAARLLIEMQEKGHKLDVQLFRGVICCLLQMNDPENHFLNLLEMQLSRCEASSHVYDLFIDGAGHAGKPDLARQVYEMMHNSGIRPTVKSDILLVQSYVKNRRISDALNFFSNVSKRRIIRRKLWQSMIVGLCKADQLDFALQIFEDMKASHLIPSIECYEELVKLCCDHRQYYMALDLVNDYTQIRPHITSFMGNILLLHALKTRKVHYAWDKLSSTQNLTPSSLKLGQLIFGCREENNDIEQVLELIENCFLFDLHTFNILLQRVDMTEINQASEYLDMLRRKGYKPNRQTYEILIMGLIKNGRNEEAVKLEEEMKLEEFDPAA